MTCKSRLILMGAGSFAALVMPVVAAEESVDLYTIHRIKAEAFENSKVMDHLFYLSDVYGPRLTNSTGFFAAVDWVVKTLGDWGIPAHLEKWNYGRGWNYTHFEAHLIEPQYAPLIGFPTAWTAGTNGRVSGEVVMAALDSDSDLEANKGKLKGKIVLLTPGPDLQMSMEPLGRRLTDGDLANLALAPLPAVGGRGGAAAGGRGRGGAGPNARPSQTKVLDFLRQEAPLVIVRPGINPSQGGTVFSGVGAGTWDPKVAPLPASVLLTPEHFNRIVRLLEHKVPVKMEFDIRTNFDERTDSVNVIAQIDGGRKKDEVVMIGAHLDSWQGGTGATDNGAGCSVMLETMRILKTLNVKLDRSVRIALWSGEEENVLGSTAYVKQHFADRATMKPTEEHAKLDAYFNVDAGSGKIRGVTLQGNDTLRPIFTEWLKPFADLGATTVSNRVTGASDHAPFDAVGLNGISFIQDPLEYATRTHHSNMDVYDRAQAGDMAQMAAIVASFVYLTANREEMLPRVPLPKPQPPRSPAGNGAAAE
jgi:carboxypeptidase Q